MNTTRLGRVEAKSRLFAFDDAGDFGLVENEITNYLMGSEVRCGHAHGEMGLESDSGYSYLR